MLRKSNQMTIDDISEYDGIYSILIKDNNIWKQMNDLVDFSFVYDLLKDSYSSTMVRIARMFKYRLLKQYYKLFDADMQTKG